MNPFQPLDFLNYVLFSLVLALYSFLVVFLYLPKFPLILSLQFYYLLLVIFALFLLLSFQLIILRTLLHNIFGLVGVVLLQPILKFFLLSAYLFINLLTSDIFLLQYGVVLLVELSFI